MNFDIKLDQISLSYQKELALQDITTELQDGKIYGLLGRNGAGKTSLMSLLASFCEPTSGTIMIGSQHSFENSDIMPHISFIYPTDYTYYYEKVKTIIEDAQKYRPSFDENYAQHLIQVFNLPLDKKVNQLSKGMQSALNVTIGLASRSAITIFDEAYVGMDAPTREKFYHELFEDQQRFPRTFIISTHLISEMEYLFDEVLIIDQGKLVLHESHETLSEKGAVITGTASIIDPFTAEMRRINEQQLGGTKAVMVYEEFSEQKRFEAEKLGLQWGPISIHDLFIHLTQEEEATHEYDK